MKYVFTAQFLKITPPETSFADAWKRYARTCLGMIYMMKNVFV